MRPAPLLLVVLASSIGLTLTGPALAALTGGQAVIAGFLPPVAAVQSGTQVAYSAIDFRHTFSEGGQGVPLASLPCVDAVLDPGGPAGGARFSLVDGRLVATRGATTRACSSATVEGPVATMRFFCTVHPATMNGVLVVVAA